MELDVTHMVYDADEMPMLSGSVVELGKNAGPFTYSNSIAYAKHCRLLKTDKMRDAARAYFKEYGAWSEEEIAGWSEDELQGIMCQDVAADIREMSVAKNYKEYRRLCEQGTCLGRLYKGDNNHWYFYLGI